MSNSISAAVADSRSPRVAKAPNSKVDSHKAEFNGNILLEVCGQPKSPSQIAKVLSSLPERPLIEGLLPHERLHLVSRVRDLHLPSPAGIAVARQIDLMLREGYRNREPNRAASWQSIYALCPPNDLGKQTHVPQLPAAPLAASVIGVSGVGKTAAIERALSLYPQCVEHDRFPHMAGKHRQLVWLKVEVPESGKAADLARSLALATDAALGTNHFMEDAFLRNTRGSVLLNLWLRRVVAHFPGIISLDEIQNLFKIATLSQRTAGRQGAARPQLRIVDDEALKFILTLINVARIPILASGTPDSMAIFETRMSTSQRLTIEGLIRFDHATSSNDGYFKDVLMPALLKYQWLDQKIQCTPALLEVMHRYTAGLPRLCVNLWVQAQRLALDKSASVLEVKHIDTVAATTMAPVRAAVEALLSGDPRRIRQYEDLRPDFNQL